MKKIIERVVANVLTSVATKQLISGIGKGYLMLREIYEKRRVPGRTHPLWDQLRSALTNQGFTAEEATRLASDVLGEASENLAMEEAVVQAFQRNHARRELRNITK